MALECRKLMAASAVSGAVGIIVRSIHACTDSTQDCKILDHLVVA